MRKGTNRENLLGVAATVLGLLLAGWMATTHGAEYDPRAIRITQDPETYAMGWSHAFTVRDPDTGEWAFLPLMGHNHSPGTNNSVRIFRPLADKWRYWQRDLQDQLTKEEWFSDKQTKPPSASGRNNYIGFYLPWEGEAGQLWIAAPGGSLASNHGVFDLAEKEWTRLVGNGNKKDFAPVRYANDRATKLVSGWNYADAVCDSRRTLVRYGGKHQGILVLVTPAKDGRGYVAKGFADQPPGQRNQVRNAAICVDGKFYLFGGNREWKGKALSEVWRLDVETREWTRLPSTPHPVPPLAQVTYDPDIERAVILFNRGTRIGTYDLSDGEFRDLSGTLDLPAASNAVGSFVPGVGHLYRGGEWDDGGWTSSRRIYCVSLAPEQDCG